MGDSLSAGYGIKITSGWVALLEQRLQTEGYEYKVINASVSGETSSGANSRLPALLQTHHPDLVIIELGANDGLRGLPVKQMRTHLTEMIERIKIRKGKVLLIGMQIPPNYGEQYTNAFSQTFIDLANTYRLPFVPFLLEQVALDSTLMQSDNLHPNERGQPLLLDTVWPHLKKLLNH